MALPFCRDCKISLTPTNWSKAKRERPDHICNPCAVKRTQEWQKNHPNYRLSSQGYYKRHRKARNEYMNNYWKNHPEKHRKYVRITGARRRRELPTNVILNEHFEGAHLHHMTPSVAVYIPKALHKSVFHNLKTGKGMTEINAEVKKWLEQSL